MSSTQQVTKHRVDIDESSQQLKQESLSGVETDEEMHQILMTSTEAALYKQVKKLKDIGKERTKKLRSLQKQNKRLQMRNKRLMDAVKQLKLSKQEKKDKEGDVEVIVVLADEKTLNTY